MPRPDPDTLTQRLIDAYVRAVLAFIETDIPQGIDYDFESQDFKYCSVAEGMCPTDVGLWVCEMWPKAVGKLNVPMPGEPGYSEALLAQALRERLSRSTVASVLAKSIVDIVEQDWRYMQSGEGRTADGEYLH